MNGKAMDWRLQIAVNRRRSLWVMITFIMIYTCLGFFLDLLIHVDKDFSNYNYYSSETSLFNMLWSLITFQTLPWMMLLMQALALISIGWMIIRGQKILLMGTESTEITADTDNKDHKQLWSILEEMCLSAGITTKPKLHLLHSETMNAFASGWNEQYSMIAVSQGLVDNLNRQELSAVMAHELSHIINQDIKLMLTVTVLSNIMLLVVNGLFRWMIFSPRRNNNKNNNNLIFFIVLLLRIILPLITSMLMLYLSRKREFLADAGAVRLTRDPESLGHALIKVNQSMKSQPEIYESEVKKTAHEELREASYFYSPMSCQIFGYRSMSQLFSTHPSLENRLKALGMKAEQVDKVIGKKRSSNDV